MLINLFFLLNFTEKGYTAKIRVKNLLANHFLTHTLLAFLLLVGLFSFTCRFFSSSSRSISPAAARYKHFLCASIAASLVFCIMYSQSPVEEWRYEPELYIYRPCVPPCGTTRDQNCAPTTSRVREIVGPMRCGAERCGNYASRTWHCGDNAYGRRKQCANITSTIREQTLPLRINACQCVPVRPWFLPRIATHCVDSA